MSTIKPKQLNASGTRDSTTFLRGDDTWAVPAGGGSGDVAGPASATDNAIARYDTTTGKLIQNSGGSVDDSGNITGNNLSGTNTGDQTITLTGDVTGSGTGSFAATIGSGKVTTAKILDDAVTLAKLDSGSTGGLISYAAFGAPSAVAAGTTGQFLKSVGGTGAAVFADLTTETNVTVKPSQQTTSSDPTMTNDDHLLMDGLAASTKYSFEVFFLVSNTNGTPDFQCQLSNSTGAGFTGHGYVTQPANSVEFYVLTLTSFSTKISIPSSGTVMVKFVGSFTTGSSGGTVNVQWAQGTSHSSTTTVRENSYVKWTREF